MREHMYLYVYVHGDMFLSIGLCPYSCVHLCTNLCIYAIVQFGIAYNIGLYLCVYYFSCEIALQILEIKQLNLKLNLNLNSIFTLSGNASIIPYKTHH